MNRINEVGPGNRVVHLVGRVTDVVFSFLGPATAALAERGVAQTVVLIDDARQRRLLPHFHASVRLVLTHDGSVMQRMNDLLDRLCDEVSAEPTTAVHLHGFVPSLLAAYAARFRKLPTTMIFSPHGSKSLSRFRGAGNLLMWALKPPVGRSQQHTIATSALERTAFHSSTWHDSVNVIESPVESVFFDCVHRESPQPRVITGNRSDDPRSAALFAQLAVLLSDDVFNLRFKWLGTAKHDSLARLQAAGVEVREDLDHRTRAQELASSWLYLAPDGNLGFPVFLAEAMAVGLPCVARDTPYHRDLLRDGESGFLCQSEEEMASAISKLVESADLRRRVGRAARKEAESRFSQEKFREAILEVYADSMRGTLD